MRMDSLEGKLTKVDQLEIKLQKVADRVESGLQFAGASKKKGRKGLLYYFVVYRWMAETGETGWGNAVISLMKTVGRDNYKTLLQKVKAVADRDGNNYAIVIVNYMLLRGYRE
jgi:hypothetical protein